MIAIIVVSRLVAVVGPFVPQQTAKRRVVIHAGLQLLARFRHSLALLEEVLPEVLDSVSKP